MSHAHDITLTVNGETAHARVEARKSLVDFLREDLSLTGSHVGCEHGVCGACTVRVNGEVVRGCLMLAVQCDGASVETIEGVSDSGEIADLQDAFETRNALQCGYCTPGMLLTAQELLANGKTPSRDEIREHISGNYCRCTGYHAIVDAVESVAQVRNGSDMKIVSDVPSPLTALDRPNSYIGRSVPRPNLKRLAQGRAQYVSDMTLPRMGHVAYLRSPHAHARIVKIDKSKAEKAPGVIAVVTGPELAKVITPWVGVLTHLKGIKSAPQYAIAVDRACWQGEAVCVVVAQTRAQAEDACELIEIAYQELPAVTDPETALDPGTPLIHPELGDNLTFERTLDAGEVDKAFAESDAVIEQVFHFGRHTGVCNEPRAILADWNSGEERLTVYHATQAPHMMQNLFAKHLDLAEHQVRVVTKDVGGSFGIKVHTYADEMAVVALSKMLKRPIKFVADRLESFVTDIHARDHRVKGKIGIRKDGTITAFEIDDLTGIGPYSVYPRTSGIEANQIVNLTGGPYTCPNYRARARVVFQNKNVMCQYRAVGHPIATAVTEGLVDLAAAKIGLDPVEVRKKNLIPDNAHPSQAASGIKFEKLSHIASTEKILTMMDYKALRADQAAARAKGIHRGIGFASFIEVTNPSAAFYGVGGAKISAQDGATVRLDGKGAIFCHTGVSEQGQGAEAVIAQCVASAFGVSMDKVRVIMGDTDNTPYGGGTWASRAAGIGGEAAWQAGKALRENVLAAAGSILQAKPGDLDIDNGIVVDKGTKTERISLEEVARVCYFRPDTLPPGFQAELVATRHYVPRAWAFSFTNGIQASYLEVDTDTGFIKLLKHFCVEDCGTVINPQLVDEQIRGGIVQGLGGALFEHCLYDERGQMLNGNMADYLVPMAMEMPDMEVGHVVTPTADSELGAKGAGEAGTAGAPACVMNAINDALRPLGAKPLTDMPFTPGKVLRALGKV